MSNYVNYTAISRSRTLAHYASPYYDPVKAHEYYMKNRELKGRQSTSGLNDEGKSHAAYIKEQINTERDRKIESRKEEVSKSIEEHTAKMSSEIARLESKLAGMSREDKRKNVASIRQEIAQLRQANSAKRAELSSQFLVDKQNLQSEAALRYLQELMALNDSGEFRKETASKSSKSSTESAQKGPAKTTGTVYKSKRLKQILG